MLACNLRYNSIYTATLLSWPHWMDLPKKIFLCILISGALLEAIAGLDGSYVVPLEHEALQYSKAPVNDPVTDLMGRIATGKTKPAYDADFGYLRFVLEALNVPVSSQVLVFSKTSFQAPRISPRTPRALYFNDDVMVGFVRGGDVLEIIAADPRQGAIFYTVDQEQSRHVRFDRQDQCLQCHDSGATLGVPGPVVRSVFPDRSGLPVFQAGSFITDHRSPLEERWGGWYVTGTHGGQLHMGNSFVESKDRPEKFDRKIGANVTDLKPYFDTGAYLTPHSDVVALMILEHQVRMRNLITRVGFEARMALTDQKNMNHALGEPADYMSDSTKRRIRNAVEEMVGYMLFADEMKLKEPIQGTSDFAKEYSLRGPRDQQGRSLREFDLKQRLLRFPCSPLIYSAAFDALPEIAKRQAYIRMREVLTGTGITPNKFAHLSTADKKAIYQILLETKAEAKKYWSETASEPFHSTL